MLDLTNHSSFNLAGESTISAMGEKVYMDAEEVTTANSLSSRTASRIDGSTRSTSPTPAARRWSPDQRRHQRQLLFRPGYDPDWEINDTGPELDRFLLDAAPRIRAAAAS